MIHLPQLITDLALILAAAGLTTIIFKKFRQPLVLGYILAGFLVGPHFSFVPTVFEEKSITIWAEIGVIFLLFNLGLEFSFKKLAKVGGPASITAVIEVICMLAFGFITGRILGWSIMDSIFLGGILSISSTTIIIRAFDELGVKHKQFAKLVFGALIVEDLVAILLLVLLSTLAVSQQFSGTEMLISVLKLSFFLTLWFLGGIFIIPTFLKRAGKLMNDETMLIVSLALCLLMVMLAVKVGFSPALGAFIMGSILAETTQAERIEHLTKSVKDLFAAVFFVSVGMLINPSVLVEYALPILIITIVTILGKLSSSCIGALLSGQPLKTSIQAGMSLAQIGEFSFIIATLGLTLKVTSGFLYPIAVAVSALTTFTTPYLIRFSGDVYNYLEKHVPARWLGSLNNYSASTQGISTLSDWKILLQTTIFNIVVHSVIILGVIFLSSRYIKPFVIANFENGYLGTSIIILISIIAIAPFLWALAIKRVEKKAYSNLWLNKKYTRGPLIALELFRVALAVFYVGLLLYLFLPSTLAIGVAFTIIAFVIVIFSRKLQAFYGRLEKHFLLNLHERELSSKKHDIVPWDAHLTELVIAPESSAVGQTLTNLAIRERFGVNIALIERGKLRIATPGRNESLYPYDKLTVIGNDEQIARLKELLEVSNDYSESPSDLRDSLELQKISISSQSPLSGQTIRESGLREKVQGLVVGIERHEARILNPESDFIFEPGDVMWIVGNKKRISEMLQK